MEKQSLWTAKELFSPYEVDTSQRETEKKGSM